MAAGHHSPASLRPVRILVAAAAVSAVLVVARGSRAWGHSFWPNSYSAKTTLSLDRAGVGATVVIEFPTASLVPKFRQHWQQLDLKKEIEAGRFPALEEEFRRVQLERLAAGLRLLVGGKPAPHPWQPVDTPINGRASEGFFVYLLETAVPAWPPGALEIVVRNELYPGENILFANLVSATDGWQVRETSVPQPPPSADLSGGSAAELELWSAAPEYRVFRVVATAPDR